MAKKTTSKQAAKEDAAQAALMQIMDALSSKGLSYIEQLGIITVAQSLVITSMNETAAAMYEQSTQKPGKQILNKVDERPSYLG